MAANATGGTKLDPVTIATAAVTILETILNFISDLKAKGGVSEDQLLQAAIAKQGVNSQLYKTLSAHIGAIQPPTVTVTVKES